MEENEIKEMLQSIECTLKRIEILMLKDKSSGMAIRVRSSKASKEPDSSTRPGMSSLVAIHTLASLSQVRLIIYSMY